jgi:hypothetical protein
LVLGESLRWVPLTTALLQRRKNETKLIKQCSTVTREVLGFKGDVFGALDQGVFLKEVVVAVGEVGAVVAAAGFFAG